MDDLVVMIDKQRQKLIREFKQIWDQGDEDERGSILTEIGMLIEMVRRGKQKIQEDMEEDKKEYVIMMNMRSTEEFGLEEDEKEHLTMEMKMMEDHDPPNK